MKSTFAVVIFALVLAVMVFLIVGSEGSEPKASAEAFYPEPSNYAVDAAGVLDAKHLKWVNDKLAELDGDRQQLAVVVVKTTAPLGIEEYSIRLAEKWKVGKADMDDGAILVVATEDRKVRIEVGDGLQVDLTDAESGRILDEQVLPQFKKGDWYAGIMAGIVAIKNEVNK